MKKRRLACLGIALILLLGAMSAEAAQEAISFSLGGAALSIHTDGTAPDEAYINSSRGANVLFFDGHVDHRNARSLPLLNRAPFHKFWYPWTCCDACEKEAARANNIPYN